MPHATRTFRVFISSTFSDLRAERDALQEHVFPALSRLCTAAGATFQPIDLRWGVSDEAGLDQQTMAICLTELARCQDTGVKPNFLILLGDRYGWLPLPPAIPADEYERLLAAVDDPGAKDLLKRWYGDRDAADRNSRPAVHHLKARDPHGEFADPDAWASEEAAVRDVLLGALEKVPLAAEALVKYRASATEQEIIAGAVEVPDAAEHVFCFARSLSGLPEQVRPLPAKDPARPYRNFRNDGSLDTDAETALAGIRGRLSETLGEHYVLYSAEWTAAEEGVSCPSSRHIGRLSPDPECPETEREQGDAAGTLCRDVYDRLAGVIRAQLSQLRTMTAAEQEAAAVAEFIRERTKFFTGRVNALGGIREYLTSTGRQPLALWGGSGSGKSTVLARTVQDATGDGQPAGVNVIAKFIGATSSGDGREMLDDLSAKIDSFYGQTAAPGGRTYEDLTRQFPDKLALADGSKPLWIFLDALDQLSEANGARDLAWLPEKVPENVRIVVSTTPGECLANLQRKLHADQVVELEPMTVDEGDTLLTKWLDDAGRALSFEQRAAVLKAFAGCPVPLYLRLGFEEARRWTSVAGVQPLAADTPGLIRQMFARLADPANHGPELVDRVVSSLAASRYGLSEEELLGVLAWDDAYWARFVAESAYHDLPQTMRGSERERWRRRIPVAVWARLYNDLQPYLTEREVEGARVLAFYHRQLGEVAYLDFLADRERDDDARRRASAIENELGRGTLASGEVLAVPLNATGRERHRLLAEYFRWAADPSGPDDEGRRSWRGGTARGLSELPYHQAKAHSWDELYETLTDFGFIENKCARVGRLETVDEKGESRALFTGAYALQEDYATALTDFPGE